MTFLKLSLCLIPVLIACGSSADGTRGQSGVATSRSIVELTDVDLRGVESNLDGAMLFATRGGQNVAFA